MKIGLLAISKRFAVYHTLIGSTVTVSDLHQELQWVTEITRVFRQRCLFLTAFPALHFQEQITCVCPIKIQPHTGMLLTTTQENINQKKMKTLHGTNHTADATNLSQW